MTYWPPTVIALNVGLIVLAIIAFAATVFLFVRNDQQKHFLMALAASARRDDGPFRPGTHSGHVPASLVLNHMTDGICVVAAPRQE